LAATSFSKRGARSCEPCWLHPPSQRGVQEVVNSVGCLLFLKEGCEKLCTLLTPLLLEEEYEKLCTLLTLLLLKEEYPKGEVVTKPRPL